MPPGGGFRDEVLHRQRAAAERLRSELLGADGSLDHPYFEAMQRELRGSGDEVEPADLIAACSFADLVYIGDFHALPGCQRFVAGLLVELAARVSDLSLGIEFVYARQQRLLDARQSGELDDASFLRRIHYREEWGYPWDGFATLLNRARELEVPVHALDAPPRGGFEGLDRRDDHAARRIATIVEASPATRLVVLYGESHVARAHIPRKVKSRLKRSGLERREVRVYQNPDELYWRLLADRGTPPSAVRVDDSTFAVFHTSPLAKYEAYRQVLERWRDDVPSEEEVDLTPAVHHLIEVLLGWLEIRGERHRLKHRAGWVESLVDAFPEVYSGPEALELLGPILQDHGRSEEEIEEGAVLLRQRGALYESRSNTLFLLRYLPGRAAGEAARFLRTALTGRLFIPPEEVAEDPAARAYGAAYNEALAYLGARLVDPASDYLSGDEMRAAAAACQGVPGSASADLEERIRWLEAHAAFEKTRTRRPPEDLLETLRSSRTLARNLARDLGHRLGRNLFALVRSGRLDGRALRALFTRSLDPDRAPQHFTRLLRGDIPWMKLGVPRPYRVD